MPQLYNVDHQHAILDADTSVAPGAAHTFTDEQIEAGLSGRWWEEDPRAGLKAEKAFKRRRDAKARAVEDATDDANPEDPAETAGDTGTEAAEADANTPAEPGDHKESK